MQRTFKQFHYTKNVYQRVKQSRLTLTHVTQKSQRHSGLGQPQRDEVKPVYGIPPPLGDLNGNTYKTKR